MSDKVGSPGGPDFGGKMHGANPVKRHKIAERGGKVSWMERAQPALVKSERKEKNQRGPWRNQVAEKQRPSQRKKALKQHQL